MVEWDGKPGKKNAPRNGGGPEGTPPKRLRYGAATKSQLVTDGFPERTHYLLLKAEPYATPLLAKQNSSTIWPPIRCSWMMRSSTSGVAERYQTPSG